MRSVELFSGCGGLALGTARAGFAHAKMVEWNTKAHATLAYNKALGIEHARDWPFVHDDVRAIKWSELAGDIWLVAGGPPCQPFSIGGRHKGQDDPRDMWPEAIRAVRELRPRAFLFENVRGLARPAFNEYLAWIKAHLAAPSLKRRKNEAYATHLERLTGAVAEYDVVIVKVNAADFGAAQKRHRVVVAGIHRDIGIALKPLTHTHSRDRLLWDQWISGEYWDRHGISAPSAAPQSEADCRTVARMRSDNERPKEEAWRTVRDALFKLGEPNGKNDHVLQDGAKVYPGHTGSPLDEPAKTLKAGNHGVPGGENMMVRDDGSVRYFTIREAARLQGLPDDWAFQSSWIESMRQLGNAVPVELATALGKWMAGMLNSARPSLRAA